jgi:tetratricopeptide (TPR) repeat protein
MRRVAALVVVSLALALCAGPAWAQEQAQEQEDDATTRARELFKQAEVHFSLGEFEKALRLYKEAFKTKPMPEFLFNIGQCHRNMEQCDKALFFFRQFLVRAPEAPNRKDVEQLIRICEAEEKTKQSQTTDETEPASQPAQPQGPVPQEPPADVSKRGKLHPVWFWSGAGLAAALLVTGTVTGVVALRQSSEYKEPTTSIDRRRELKDSGETLRTVSTATVVAGAVAAAGTGVLYFFTDWGPKETTVSAGPLRGGAAVVLAGRF